MFTQLIFKFLGLQTERWTGIHGNGKCVTHSIDGSLENQVQQTNEVQQTSFRNEGPREPPSPCPSCRSNSLTGVRALVLWELPRGHGLLPVLDPARGARIPVCPFCHSLQTRSPRLRCPLGQHQLFRLCLRDLGFEGTRISPFRVPPKIPRSGQQKVVHTLNGQKWPFSFSL